MALVSKKLPHISLDGKWFPCHPGSEFGFLGDRLLCDLVTTSGQPPKKLLLRPLNWSQGKSPNDKSSSPLEVDKVPDGAGLGLRPFAGKTYDYAIPSAEGKLKRQERQFLQQDITGLITLREAILKVVKDKVPRKVWFLFYSACKALNTYGKSIGSQQSVPLQCPNGLAVDAKTGQVVMLDAEMKIPVLSEPNETAFVKWFGIAGRERYAQDTEASSLHSRALLLFFREVLGYLHKQEGAAGSGILAQLGAKLDELEAARSLQELQDNAEMMAEDWSIPVEDENGAPVAPIATPNIVAEAVRPAIRQPKTRTWLGWFVCSFLANLFLAVLVLLLGAMWFAINPRLSPEKKQPTPASDDSSLQFSSYCVVLPTRGTSSEKVLASLKQLYADKVLVPKQGEAEQNRLLSDHLDLAVKSLKGADKVQKLLGQLNSDYSVRFNGYSVDAKDLGLKSIIANGGLYRIASPADKMQYGSLLRANSVDRILTISGMDKQPDARALLESLKAATHEYASIKDAVTIIGDRTAFILRVEPTAAAHEVVRTHLLGRDPCLRSKACI
ncbi:MAG: hypothetical protein EXR98_04030 [Gemmataceae bacterium]|nr:hypothetical protein [Gemmataceae bacterium]